VTCPLGTVANSLTVGATTNAMNHEAVTAAGLFALVLGLWVAQKRARKPQPVLRIAYYITGHGLGHAVRSSAVSASLQKTVQCRGGD